MCGARFILQTTNDVALALRKPRSGTRIKKNYIFEAEASNENIDLQKQVVLQRALLESKDHFLKNGVISFNHLHRSDPSMIIGKPIEVRTEGKRTIVKGILYHTSDMANEIVKHLKAGSTKIKASVGGSRLKPIHDIKTGTETITSVIWNDLALTLYPVNSTVSPVCLIKGIA